MCRLIFSLFLFLASLEGFVTKADADSVILMNGNTGAVLYEKEADTPRYPASLTKVATALYVLEKEGFDFETVVSPSEEALFSVPDEKKHSNFLLYPPHRLERQGTSIGLKPGKPIPLWVALYGMLISSGNGCSNVLAESYGKSIPGFVESMNQYLLTIGCKNSHFLNPHGLHHPEHKTTARDLALMTKKALSLPVFREIVSSKGFFFPNVGKKKKQYSQNNFLLRPTSRYYYPYAIGVKTGYTESAKACLLAAAEKEGRRLIAVILGSSSKTKRYETAIELFEKAFSEEEKTALLVGKRKKFTKLVPEAKKTLKAKLQKDLTLTYYPSEKPKNLRVFLHWGPVSLPVKKGDLVGVMKVYSGETVLLEEPVYAQEAISRTFFGKIGHFFKRCFSFGSGK